MAKTDGLESVCHLLRLPRELRDDIYTLVATQPFLLQARRISSPGFQFYLANDFERDFVDDQAVTDPIAEPVTQPVTSVHRCGNYRAEPALSIVSKQIREEVLSIYHGHNTFTFRLVKDPRPNSLSVGLTNCTWCPRSRCDNAAWMRRVDLEFSTRIVTSSRHKGRTAEDAWSTALLRQTGTGEVSLRITGQLEKECTCRLSDVLKEYVQQDRFGGDGKAMMAFCGDVERYYAGLYRVREDADAPPPAELCKSCGKEARVPMVVW